MPGEASRLKVPRGYFTDFVEQIVRTLNRFSEHEAGERVAEYQRRLDEHTQAFLRELDVYNERLVPGARPSRMVDRKCMEQELYLYEPLQYWDEDQQLVMRTIIEERLHRILPNLASFLEAGALKLK